MKSLEKHETLRVCDSRHPHERINHLYFKNTTIHYSENARNTYTDAFSVFWYVHTLIVSTLIVIS